MLKRADESTKLSSPQICDAVVARGHAIVGEHGRRACGLTLIFLQHSPWKKSKTSEAKALNNKIKGEIIAKNFETQDAIFLLWYWLSL